MAQDVMILMRANLLQGPLEGAGSENLFWATSTKRRKAKINLFTFLCGLTLPLGRINREKKDLEEKKENVLNQNFSVEVILEADPNKFRLRTFSLFYLSLLSLCIKYTC